ncbi:MAG: DUF2110 family protein [Halobacteria archaeon]
MNTVLNARIYVSGGARERALDSFGSQVRNLLEDLDAEPDIDLRKDDRIEVAIDGDDSEAASSLLEEKYGRMETDPEEDESYIGTLESWGPEGFTIDVGSDVQVQSSELEELGKGNPSQIRERYGLVQHVPLEVTYGETPKLSDVQVDSLWGWRKGNGRLNVNSATRSEVRATVNRAGHADDIVTVERLGVLEQSVICREGTDPPGLLADVGGYIQGEMKCVVT